jgi:hypothetical protein
MAGFLLTDYAYDVNEIKDFDIVGVKLGMDAEQAKAALAKHFNLDAENIFVHMYDSDITKTSIPSSIEASGKDFANVRSAANVKIWFAVRIPLDKVRPVAVNSIVYQVLDNTQKSRSALLKETLAKYGTPTFDDGWGGRGWCVPVVNKCDKNFAQLRVTHEKGRNYKLRLDDPTYEAAVAKYQEDLKR